MRVRWTIAFYFSLLFLSNGAYAQRWEQVALPAPYDTGYYLDIFFLPSSPQYGWACDQTKGYVIRTTNGGATWAGTKVIPSATYCHLEYIQFLDTNTGYASGPCGAFKSTDGGASWTQLSVDTTYSIWGGWFRSASVGWFAGGTCGVAKFFRTIDGGQSFTVFTDTTIKRSNLSDPLWMSDLPDSVVYAIGNGTLWISTDDGQTWGVESYTGSDSPWHEELARFGQSFAIPNATSECPSSDYSGGGMRFSADAGQTWNNFETGSSMFGTFLLDESRAWASGWTGNVWYTSNKGVDWNLRNCGIGSRGMDDIFFQNDSTGWVVGEGVFRLAKAKRTVSDSLLFFRNVCPDSLRYDTVWVENINFFPSQWELKLVGPENYLYRVVNAVPTPMPACSRVMVIVEYRGSNPGAHTASLVINIYNPDTTLVVNLNGTRRGPSAVPEDTLVQYSVRVGQTADRTLNWTGRTVPTETIVEIQRISGDTSISIVSTLPLLVPVPPPTTQMIIRATPRDTGWIVARFRIRLGPCDRDTFITVKVYGLSPIFNGIKQLGVDTKCEFSDTLLIPVSNTGNIPLIISSINVQSSGQPAFSTIDFTSGRIGPPWILAKGELDTLEVLFVPQSGDDAANIIFNHDDNTLTRGVVNPWTVELRGISQRPSFTIQPTVIELGSRCLGTSVDTLYKIINEGRSTFTALSVPSSSRISGISSGASSIPPNQRKDVRFKWTPMAVGEVWDTITITINPCDSVSYVIIHATVIDGGVTANPNPLIDSVLVGNTLTRTVVVRPRNSETVSITAISFLPVYPNLSISYPALPADLSPTDSLTITFVWLPTAVTSINGTLSIESEGVCKDIEQVSVSFRSISNQVSINPRSLDYTVQCAPSLMIDSIKVSSTASIDITVGQPIIVEPNTPFSIQRPLSATTLKADSSVYVVVSYDPSISANATATLRLTFPSSGEVVDIPLSGKYEQTSISVSQSVFDVDSVGACDNVRTLDIVIRNDGSVDETIDVGTTNLPVGFSVSSNTFTVPAQSSATLTLTCTPAQLLPGQSSGFVTLIARKCPDTLRISSTAYRVDGQLTVQPNPVNAGTLIIGDSSNSSVIITNPSSVPRTIVSLSIDPPLSAWSIINNVSGQTINPTDSLPIILRFMPTTSGAQNARLVLVDAERCTTQSSVDLLGRGRDPGIPPEHELDLLIDDYVVAPLTTLEIPVRWMSDISDALVDTLRFSVVYSWINFTLDTILDGSLTDAAVDAEAQDGRVDFTIIRNGPDLGKPGIVAVLRGVANPAIPDSTAFAFSQLFIKSLEPVEIITDDGLLIVDACGPRNIISFAAPATISILPPHPIRDVVNLEINTPYNELISVEIIDAIGNSIVSLGNFSAHPGTSDLTVPMPVLASGMYVLVIRTNHGGRFVNTIVVNR